MVTRFLSYAVLTPLFVMPRVSESAIQVYLYFNVQPDAQINLSSILSFKYITSFSHCYDFFILLKTARLQPTWKGFYVAPIPRNRISDHLNFKTCRGYARDQSQWQYRSNLNIHPRSEAWYYFLFSFDWLLGFHVPFSLRYHVSFFLLLFFKYLIVGFWRLSFSFLCSK